MSDQPTDHIQDRSTRFIEYLRGFSERDERGVLAALRRSLQEPSGIAMSACPYIVPFLPTPPDRFVERTLFLIGALFALHPQHAVGVSLGHVFRRLNGETAEGQKGADNDSTRARFVALLDSHPDDVSEHLRHAVSLARSKEIPIDWARLCKDLLSWGAEDRWVQRRLAADFWGSDVKPPRPAASENSEKPDIEVTP